MRKLLTTLAALTMVAAPAHALAPKDLNPQLCRENYIKLVSTYPIMAEVYNSGGVNLIDSEEYTLVGTTTSTAVVNIMKYCDDHDAVLLQARRTPEYRTNFRAMRRWEDAYVIPYL
jgi:hypothetical protein